MNNKITRIVEYLVAVSILAIVSSVNFGWSQGTQMQGIGPSLQILPVQVDSTGKLLAVASGNTSSLLFSSVTTSAISPVRVTNANTARKVFFLQNLAASNSICYSTISPITCGSTPVLAAGASLLITSNVPTNTFYVLGVTGGVSPVVAIGEGQ